MQIILEEDEIKAALVAYATSMITIKDDQEITIDMKAGRGENGYSATLNIQPKAVAPIKATRAKPTPVEVKAVNTIPAAAAPAKSGLFGKTPAAEPAPAREPEPEPDATSAGPQNQEEPVAGISTGEDRGEAPELNQDLDVSGEDVTSSADAIPDEAPAEKPKSIFNFAKPAAAAGA